MWKLVKVWWLMGRLQKRCLQMEGECSITDYGQKAVVKTTFITEESLRILNKFNQISGSTDNSYIPCASCKPEKFEKAFEEDSLKKVLIKRAEYEQLIRIAEKKGYVMGRYTEDDEEEDCGYIIRLSEEGEAMTGIFDLFEILFKQYKLTLTAFLLPILTFLLGLYLG